jgi:hypothetical protein
MAQFKMSAATTKPLDKPIRIGSGREVSQGDTVENFSRMAVVVGESVRDAGFLVIQEIGEGKRSAWEANPGLCK